MLHIKLTLIVTIILGMVSFSACSKNDQFTPEPKAAQPHMELTEVYGEHNPYMIGGWGGEKTRESWFIQTVWSGKRIKYIEESLIGFYTLNDRLPSSLDELYDSGIYFFSPKDPVSGDEIIYGKTPVSETDFINLMVNKSSERWEFSGNTPMYPSGEWRKYTWTVDSSEEYFTRFVELYRESYPTTEAIKGAYLSNMLASMLWDWTDRRGKIPDSSDDLLDNLWILKNAVCANSSEMNFPDNSALQFGYSESMKIVGAVWYDSSGNVYRQMWTWNPWPQPRRTVPKAGESPIKDVDIYLGPDIEYFPETILWTCRL